MAIFAFTSCADNSESTEPVSSEAPAESSEPEPVVEEEPELYPSLITGIEKGADYPINQRVLAVMINNRETSLPQSGISEASACYEIVTEGGITRYMLIFEDYTTIPLVGPVRSARDQHVQLMAPLNALYLHDGGSTMALQLLKDLDWSNGDLAPGGATFRIDRPGYKYEDTEYTDAETFTQAVSDPDYNVNGEPIAPLTLHGFIPYDEIPVIPDNGPNSALQMSWSFSQSYDGYFEYNEITGKYEKSQFGTKLYDENNNEPVAFNNVLVLFTDIVPYGDTVLMDVDLDVGGGGYYFYGGAFEKITWQKGAPTTPLSIYKLNGEPLLLNTGTTYVSVVDYDMHETLVIADETGADIMKDTVESADELVEAED